MSPKPALISEISTDAVLDPRYGCGVECTWHGHMDEVSERRVSSDSGETIVEPCCPTCSGPIRTFFDAEHFYGNVNMADRDKPGFAAMIQWSRGRCYPDFETLENAYRQAMEE